MNNLDSKTIYDKLDRGLVGKSIESLPDQIEDVILEMKKVKFPKSYKNIKKVVVAGMGGSNLPYQVIKSLFKKELKAPVVIEAGYIVPEFVDRDTLYVISSYSGNTEEPIGTYKEAKKRGAKVAAICALDKKSRLYKLIQKENIPALIFDAKNNPSNQPRLGLGYSIFGGMALFHKAGVLKVDFSEVKEVVKMLRNVNKKLRIESKTKSNPAKVMAKGIYGKEVVLVASEVYEGNLHVARNQFYEGAKSFASYLPLPDINHYALEGLGHPKSNKKNMVFIFVDSDLDHPYIKIRSKLTKDIVKKNGVSVLKYKLSGRVKLIQSFEMLSVFVWTTFYLAMLNGEDPSQIPWVDWFKVQLEKAVKKG